MRNFLKMKDLGNDEVFALINRAIYYKNNDKFYTKYENKIVANLFLEDSTRTKMSFQVAENKLGCKLLNFYANTSSINKGETFYDTCKTFASLGVDALVIRHSINEYYNELIGIDTCLINAGDGSGEHPSQCLLDLVTIYEQFGTFEGLKVGIVGDIKNSRVAKSNKIALEKLGAKVFLVAPSIYQDSQFSEYYKLNEIIGDLDVCMLLRVQHERHTVKEFDLDTYRADFALKVDNYKKLKDNAIIMHPAPVNRGVEIDSCLVECEKSKIFPQMTNGVFARMAIFDYVFEGL
ncbi:aspartate carbamoyltransferase catalytic subunit [Campylobacter sp. MG1]|uniref:aspartate carbamoyltransferase catalytic subunit n=1 Tax=Campylobacter sp. MG1 TaxID=2976332 RepID=UPI00226CB6EB|nr:aspartate carbamoyltransferase catalytic subunit [Campylobacter sp. MG1]